MNIRKKYYKHKQNLYFDLLFNSHFFERHQSRFLYYKYMFNKYNDLYKKLSD